MAEAKCKVKRGMGGSRCGRSRYEKTEVLKRASKKTRRREWRFKPEAIGES
jgi:hypothetical protein